ncbi:hypothetical protein L4D00_17015 [Photobacterium swingsii]
MNIYIIYDWLSFYKIDNGNYSAKVKDINIERYSLTKVNLTISDSTISILMENQTPYEVCRGSTISATYNYNQHFLSKTIKLTQGQLTANHQKKACRVKIYNEFARVLGYGTSQQLGVVKGNTGDLCFRSNQLGTYCFGLSND